MHQNLTEEVNNKSKEHSGESYKNIDIEKDIIKCEKINERSLNKFWFLA